MNGEDIASGDCVERRATVWCALSDLFLDTELQPDDFDRIAKAIREAGFGVAEAKEILRNEVAPVFIANGMSVAGEWAGWPEGFVREKVSAYLAEGKLRRMLAAFWARQHAELYEDGWNEVASRLATICRSRG